MAAAAGALCLSACETYEGGYGAYGPYFYAPPRGEGVYDPQSGYSCNDRGCYDPAGYFHRLWYGQP